ncbi:DUF192 domain-containing protein [Hansschlegelia quercus]|uniref:DUF192 domain-containing protein n=1 Tax=Hansschlegelia quercus TaxID=2528245 RepID=A0A4V2JDC1_9HYPH|nr:DUF192 domain-containing protein [Hansschlegelia quercus]TBN48012.1 DUF192 domain-containing protein [Hansschlegelia quercus]
MQLRMRLSVALAFVAVVTALAAVAAPRLESLAFETSSGRHEFQVEVAASPQEREVGLMYRRSLDPDHGMLFDFGKVDSVSMWMENTYVSLDMAFVGEDGRVTRVEEDAQPLSTRIISSGSPVKFVVELLAGTAKRIGLKPGDRVIHPRVGA